jgi:hypothetical protein
MSEHDKQVEEVAHVEVTFNGVVHRAALSSN